MDTTQTYLAHLDPTAGMLVYRLEGGYLVVERLQPPEEHTRWLAADRERPLYLRLADLTGSDPSGLVHLREDWRELALGFANLYAPPLPNRRLAPGRTVPLRHFAEEAFLLRWVLQLQEKITARARLDAARAALQVRALAPEVPDETVVHLPAPRTREAEADATGVPGSLPPDEVERQLRVWTSRHGSEALWWLATNVLASVLNLRLAGVMPVCLSGATRSGLPQLAVGFRFPSPRARIWYGLWEDLVGMRLLACERCGRPFFAARASQRFCRKNCQLAAGVERHRKRRHEHGKEER